MSAFYKKIFTKTFAVVLSFAILISSGMPYTISAAATEREAECFTDEIDDTVFNGLAATDSAKSFQQGKETAITLDEFKSAYRSADGNRGIFTFEEYASTSIANGDAVSTIKMKYGADKSLNVMTADAPWVAGVVANRTPSSGDAVATLSGGGRIYTYDFTSIIGGADYEKVTTVGFVAVSRPDENLTFAVRVNYDNNESEVITQTVYASAGSDENKGNMFFGFKAPDGCSIISLQIANRSLDSPGTSWMQFDDLCFITEEIMPPTPEADNINISGPTSVTQPPWKASLSYQYTAMVRDQNNFDMSEEHITWSVAPDREGISVSEEGLLTITHEAVEELDSVTLTATTSNPDINPAITEDFTVNIESVAPYYRADRIAKSATSYTVEEFVSDLDAAEQKYIVNGGNSDIRYEGSYSVIPYATGKEAQISQGGAEVKFQSRTDHPLFVSDTGTALSLKPGENRFEMEIEENDRLVSVGMVVLSRTAFNTARNITVNVSYSNGTEETVTSLVQKENDNTFFGFEAPSGYFITSFAIKMPDDVWGACDELGFIFEEPDSLILDEEHSLFQFSDFSSQQMDNIKENLELSNAFGRCLITSWESTYPDVIDPVSGTVTIPEAPNKSNVTLTANLNYGVLTKAKNFELYVPSKLKLDTETLDFSDLSAEEISAVTNNLTLPTMGEIYNSTITWSSGNTSIIDLDGNVTRPQGGDTEVILTATFNNTVTESGEAQPITKEFTVTVLGMEPSTGDDGNEEDGEEDGGDVTNCFTAEIDNTVFGGLAATDSAKSFEANQDKATAITLDEFKSAYSNASGNRGIFTFEEFANANGNADSGVSTINMEYGAGKSLNVTTTATPTNANWFVGVVANRTPSSGTAVATVPGGRRVYTYDFTNISGGAEYEKVTSVGFVAVSRPDENLTFAVVVNYDNNTSETMTQTVYAAAGSNENKGNMFFGFKAPEGCSIRSLQIASGSLDSPGSSFMQFDDLCFITDEVIPPPPVATSINIAGSDSVTQPPWRSSLSFQYTGMVRDQNNFDMPDESITWSVTPDIEGISISNEGLLTITREAVEGLESVTITATTPAITDGETGDVVKFSKEVAITSVAPYYRTDRIAKNATSYTVEEFVSDLDAAEQKYVVNGGNSDISHEGSYSAIPYATGKVAKVSHGGVQMKFGTRSPTDAKLVSDTGTAGTLKNLQGENKFEFEAEGNDRVVAVGIVVLGRSTDAAEVTVNISYSDGTTDSVPTTVQGVGDNAFFGFKAPAGYFINTFTVEMGNRLWGAYDEVGFIFEEPDSLILDEEYPLFQFSNFCSQQMNNIKANMELPNTFGRCSIDWTSTHNDVINPADGTVTIPDASNKSNVTLTASLGYGALTREKKFELYVPNKLDLDAAAMDFSELSTEDISSVKKNLTLPTVGEVYNSAITWSSSDTSIIDISGNVSRPQGRDKYVILTATLNNATTQSGEAQPTIKEFGITVAGTDRDSSGGGGGGGGGGGNNRPIVVPGNSLPNVVVSEPSTDDTTQKALFTDIEHVSWAYESIIKLAEAGIVNGMGDGSFAPDSAVTREQFIKMLVEALGLTDMEAVSQFSDVDESDWYYNVVATAQKLGITEGNPDGSFGSGKAITRQDMAVMAYRAVKLANITLKEVNDEINWEDVGDISEYSSEAISSMQQAGILNGFPGNVFLPTGTATRAQTAVMIHNLLEVRSNDVQ